MDLAWSPADLEFRDEVRAFLEEKLTPDLRRAGRLMTSVYSDHEASLRWQAILHDRGWAAPAWPVEHGGCDWSLTQHYVFSRESTLAGAPTLSPMGIRMVAHAIIAFGTKAQQDLFLPRILTGEVFFCQGYSEPEAGTDLASLRTSAVRQGDEYIINGQKIWTTGGHDADYLWLAVRTDPEAVKHKGISILIVDTTDPGYSWTPIILSDGAHHTNATYFNDVRVPAEMLVGEENGGWRLITTQLNHERVGLGPAGRVAGIYEQVHAWASEAGSDGVVPLDNPEAKRLLGQIKSIMRLNELLNWQVSSAGENQVKALQSSPMKIRG